MLMPSAACTFTPLATTPTAAPLPVLTVCALFPAPYILSRTDRMPLANAANSKVNPHGKSHGAPQDSDRHVGDLGNIETDAQGNSKGSVSDSFVKLIGPESVVGV